MTLNGDWVPTSIGNTIQLISAGGVGGSDWYEVTRSVW